MEALIQKSFVIGEKVLLVIITLLTGVAVVLELTELVASQSVGLLICCYCSFISKSLGWRLLTIALKHCQ